eukprot:scaffold4189_cov86-Cylindrotheca_fusiformis.AAC.3
MSISRSTAERLNHSRVYIPLPSKVYNMSKKDRRLVVYIGPPKTASTSLQVFLAQYLSPKGKGKRRVEAFKQWNFPMFFNDKAGIKRLVDNTGNKTMRYVAPIRRTIQNQPKSINLVLASEYLVNYNKVLNDRMFQHLAEWAGVDRVEVALQSRSPRIDHLVSIWKQQTQVKGKLTFGWSFRRYMCSETTTKSANTRLRRFTNPIGLAHDIVYRYKKLPVHVMDMKGATQLGIDVCHGFACSIMKVNCTKGGKWVRGLEGKTVHVNSKKRESGLTREQMEQMEALYQQRDCEYYDELHNHPLFHLHYRHGDFWPNNCSNIVLQEGGSGGYRNNSMAMLSDFRKIIQCPGYNGSNDISRRTTQQPSPTPRPPPPQLIREETPPVVLPPSDSPLKVASYIILMLLAVFIQRRRLYRRYQEND